MGCISSRLFRTSTAARDETTLHNNAAGQPANPFEGPSKRTRDGSWHENNYLEHPRKDVVAARMDDEQSEVQELQEVHWSHERHELEVDDTIDSVYPILRSSSAPLWNENTVRVAY